MQAHVSGKDGALFLQQKVGIIIIAEWYNDIIICVDAWMHFCRLRSARSSQELDRLWEEMQNKNIKPDDEIKKTYRRKKEEFGSTE